jgi:hypothetical protein
MIKKIASVLLLAFTLTANCEEISGNAKTYGAANSRDNGSHFESYIGTNPHPIYQQLNWAEDNVTTSYDVYFDGTNWRNSSTTRGYQISKTGSKLIFKTSAPALAGSNSVFTDVLALDGERLTYGTKGTRTETNCTPGLFGATIQSGFYECDAVQNNPTQWPPSAFGWWHLNVTRHSNGGNNYALQVAGSFFDQVLWYRKVNNSGTTAWTKFKASDDFYSLRANLLMTGGGTITHSVAGELKWTERIILLGGGRGSAAGINSLSGYYDINMPPIGTVITGLGGTPSQTVTAGGIPMGQWTALYYKLNPNANAVTVNANFFLMTQNSTISIADDMVLLAVTNSEVSNTQSSFVKLGTGQVLFRNNSTYRGGTPVSVINYATSALAIADTTLPVGANYTVNVGGSKQLYVK